MKSLLLSVLPEPQDEFGDGLRTVWARNSQHFCDTRTALQNLLEIWTLSSPGSSVSLGVQFWIWQLITDPESSRTRDEDPLCRPCTASKIAHLPFSPLTSVCCSDLKEVFQFVLIDSLLDNLQDLLTCPGSTFTASLQMHHGPFAESVSALQVTGWLQLPVGRWTQNLSTYNCFGSRGPFSLVATVQLSVPANQV